METVLTKRQRQILDFIAKSIRTRGYPPTFREIGKRFGIANPNGVMWHMKSLEKKGLIKRAANAARGISLVPNGTCPHCNQKIKKETK
jgi:repressor LexA